MSTTKARLMTGLGCTLPGPRDRLGRLTQVTPSYEIPLRRAARDADGHQLWTVDPADFLPGARLHIPALPEGDLFINPAAHATETD